MDNNYEIAVNSFEKGINTDLSKFKYGNQNYYDALNIHVVTDTGLSSGSVANRKGTKLDFVLPNLPSLTYTEPDGTVITIPTLSNLKIIGGTGYDNKAIVFSVAEDSGNYYTQIWYFEYDVNTGEVINANSLTKELQYDYNIAPGGIVHLMYNRNLKCKPENRIQSWIRVESDKFLRLYWEDGGLNQLRSFNLAPNPWVDVTTTGPLNLNKIQNTPQSTIDLITTSKLYEPKIIELVNGNLPRGRVCYFYRMISRDGALTAFSPFSNLVDLIPGNIDGNISEYPETYLENKTTGTQDEREADLQTTSEKAVRVKFDNLDRNYDYIQPGYVIYTEEELFEIYLFPTRPIVKNASGISYYEFIHDGLEETIYPLTIQELTQISGVFEKPKTSVPKNNFLIVANTKAEQFSLKDLDPTFDARSYSYNSAGTCVISTYDGTPEYSFVGTNFPSVNQYLDSVNPDAVYDSSLLGTSDIAYTYNYKYKSNGITLGGQGPFISYEFVQAYMDSDNNDIIPFKNNTSLSLPVDKKIGPPFISNAKDLRNPEYSSLYMSHARGERYRYGLIGVDHQGRESFVEWIADIKIPEVNELASGISHYNLYTTQAVTTGIKFNITLTSPLYNNLREIKLVRVHRSEEHMTRLGTGITGSFCNFRTHKLTWEDIARSISSIVAEYLINTVIRAIAFSADTILNILAPAVWSGVKNLLESLIENILTTILVSISGPFAALNQQLMVTSMDDYMVKVLLKTALYGISNFIPIWGNVVYSLIGQQVVEYLYETVKDFIQIRVSNISDNVYSLNNFNYKRSSPFSNTNLDGYDDLNDPSNYSSIGGRKYGYIISPLHQFDKYSYRNGDYVRLIAKYENDVPLVDDHLNKLVQIYHRDTKQGILNRTHSTAALRKWYYPNYKYNGPVFTNAILEQKTLDVGEILNPDQTSRFPKGTILNAFIGSTEKYKDDGEDIGGSMWFSRKSKVMGIGDKKHLLAFEKTFPTAHPLCKHIVDQQEFTNILIGSQYFEKLPAVDFFGLTYNPSISPVSSYFSNFITSNTRIKEPRVIDGPGDYMVSYERNLPNQYGGQGYSARSLNSYIEVETIPIKNFNSITYNTEIDLYKGDTFVGLYGAVNYNYYFDKYPGYDVATESKKALGEIFPVEVPFNMNLREGDHFIVSQNTYDLSQTEKLIKRKLKRAKRKSKRLGVDFNTTANLITPNRFLFDEFVYDPVYHQQKTFKKFYVKPDIDLFTEKTTNRIWRSENKIDGELIDSWRLFKPANYIEVEGSYGPINKLDILQDRLLFYQTNAIGSVITNERSAITDDKGQMLQMATSVPFSNYGYITTESGCAHRFGTISTNSGIYHVDVFRKKIFRLSSQGLEPLSDIKGIASLLREILNDSEILAKDETLATTPIGVHGEFYPEYGTVLFTFNNEVGKLSTTLSYNLLQDCFDSRHSFVPGMYLRTPFKLLTSNQDNNGYAVFKGEYGNVFGQYVDSYITVITNGEKPYLIKTFDNYTLFSEVYDSTGNNILLEGISAVEVSNDYQTTGLVTLTPSLAASNPTFDKIIRQERKWMINIGRDMTPSANTSVESRIRDFYVKSKFIFTNNNNKKFILHNTLTHYTNSLI
jgi:hypothetical protein